MKFKKLLSLVSAAAISASAFAGLAVTASATTETAKACKYSVDFKTKYSATNLPVAGEEIVLGDSTEGMTITVLGGTWKYYSGIAPADNDSKPAASSNIYTSGCALKFVPTHTGTVYVDFKLQNNKTMVINKDGAVFKTFNPQNIEQITTGNGDTTKEGYAIAVEANATYIVFTTGTGNPYYGMYYQPTASSTEPTATPTVAPTEAPTAVPETADWKNNSAGTTGVTATKDEDGVYTLTYAKDTIGSGFAYDLASVMTNKPEDITTADGKITVSYDVYMPSDAKAPAPGNFFIDISGTNTTSYSYGGASAETYGRLSGYGPWSDVKLIGGQNATNGKITDLGNVRVFDNWATVTSVIDLKNSKITMSYNGIEANELEGFATNKVNGLYLNVAPSDRTSSDNDVVIKIKNISAAYTDAPIPQEAAAAGETFADGTGNAAAAYRVDLTEIAGTITAPKWVITATKDGEEGTGTATVEINEDNTPNLTLTGDSAISFGLVIKDIAEGMTITGASLVYTVE